MRIGHKTWLFLGPRIIGDFCFPLGTFVYFVKFPRELGIILRVIKVSLCSSFQRGHIGGAYSLISPWSECLSSQRSWAREGIFLLESPRSDHSNGLFQNTQTAAPVLICSVQDDRDILEIKSETPVSSPKGVMSSRPVWSVTLTPPVYSKEWGFM